MEGRRIGAVLGALGINLLIAGALIGWTDAGSHHTAPVPPPLTATLIDPPRVAPPPVMARESPPPLRPRPPPVAQAPSPPPHRADPGTAAPIPPAPVAPPASDSAPAPAVMATATAAVGSAPAHIPLPPQSVGAGPATVLASVSPAPRRAGPRVDASWAGNTPPAYPASARRLGEQGEVRLDVHVGADGSVLDVRVRTSSGSSALDRSAMEAVRRWRFTPATVEGDPVAEWYRDWKWVFRLEG